MYQGRSAAEAWEQSQKSTRRLLIWAVIALLVICFLSLLGLIFRPAAKPLAVSPNGRYKVAVEKGKLKVSLTSEIGWEHPGQPIAAAVSNRGQIALAFDAGFDEVNVLVYQFQETGEHELRHSLGVRETEFQGLWFDNAGEVVFQKPGTR